MTKDQATEQARLAITEWVAQIQTEDERPWTVIEREGRDILTDEFIIVFYAVLVGQEEDYGDIFSSAVSSSTKPERWAAHLRTHGGGRNDSHGAICCVADVWFPLF